MEESHTSGKYVPLKDLGKSIQSGYKIPENAGLTGYN
jgi:hypothetical protein